MNPGPAGTAALTSDGAVLINVDALPPLNAANLEGRVLFVGAGLAENENRLVYELLDNATAQAHARLARPLSKRTEPEPEPE